MIGAEISKADNSDFRTGIRNGMINALKADNNDMQTEKFEPVIALVRKLNQKASAVSKIDIQAVLDAGWSEQTVEDLVGLVAAMKIFTILDNGLGFTSIPQASFEEMGKVTIQHQGYLPTFRYFVDSASITVNKV